MTDYFKDQLEDDFAQRRFPRFYCRTQAALALKQSLPSCPRHDGTYRIYVKDISRSSISFLHYEQLFPRERADVLLSDGKVRSLKIARSRRLQDDCFEVVGHFMSILNEVETSSADR